MFIYIYVYIYSYIRTYTQTYGLCVSACLAACQCVGRTHSKCARRKHLPHSHKPSTSPIAPAHPLPVRAPLIVRNYLRWAPDEWIEEAFVRRPRYYRGRTVRIGFVGVIYYYCRSGTQNPKA